ncbi:MAG: MATE family efflux transporter, partial [Lachnospiraceae bacterium]|nr:MATE family efflux transporter [Lachnospiraceae bacterium]
MEQEQSFYKLVGRIALPVTLQSLLQSSFSVIDQVMTGQLGSYSIAGIGLGGKFSSIYSVMISAIAAVAGIMIAQYMGKKDSREVSRSFYLNMLLGVCLAVAFTGICIFFPKYIMGIYTKDVLTRDIAAGYLQIIAFSYLPMAVMTLLATLLRCMDAASLPLYASIFSAVVNTGLNYLLIFGKLGLPRMEVKGAALATVFSQIVGCVCCILFFFIYYKKQNEKKDVVLLLRYGKECSILSTFLNKNGRMQYLGILLPILACEFFWSLGENVYTAIYGNIGTKACAAMTLTIPIQVLMIGALSGLSQAAAILIGKSLGSKAYEKAYQDSKKLMWCGFAGSVLLSLLLAAAGGFYVQIYQVEDELRSLA